VVAVVAAIAAAVIQAAITVIPMIGIPNMVMVAKNLAIVSAQMMAGAITIA
jgi:hypothetical protein